MFMALFTVPQYSYAETPMFTEVPQEEIEMPEESVLDKEIQQIDEKNILTENTYKKPIGKKFIFKKFILAMLGVMLSSFIIYFLLTLYNQIREGTLIKNNSVKTPEGEVSLKAPDDMKNAIKIFLEKTDWK
jgi:hypothetical protein